MMYPCSSQLVMLASGQSWNSKWQCITPKTRLDWLETTAARSVSTTEALSSCPRQQRVTSKVKSG